MKASLKAITMFGVKNGSHVWQPVDHHVGAAYKRKMDAYIYYVEWILRRHRRPSPLASGASC